MPVKTSTTDLLLKLKEQAQAAARAADSNQDGTLTPAEAASLRGGLKAAAQKLASGGPLQVDAFVKAYALDTKDKLTRADKNGDGFLSSAEKKTLPSKLVADIRALSRPAPSTTTNSAGLFGISGTVGPAQVTLRAVLSTGLNNPSGMAFNPKDGSLWILNRGDDSSVVVDQPGTAHQNARRFSDNSAHFMNKPVAIAFSASKNEFATVQDSNNNYSKCKDPAMQMGDNFMGPTLFTADRSIYDGGPSSHLDMLHHSPHAMGIAAGAKPTGSTDKREYWVFNGQAGSIDRYFFGAPHELGGHDHADGQTIRYASNELKRVASVPSHLALDSATGTLFIADTGNGRIARLDTRADVSRATPIQGWHNETPLAQLANSHVQSVTDASAGLVQPSGLVLHKGKLVVSDYATGHIKVFSTQGKLESDIDLGLGPKRVTGLAVSPQGKLFILDAKANALLAFEANG